MGRVLGIDYGGKRVGFAISDELGIVATPLAVHTRKHGDDAVDEALRICSERGIGKIVVGLPLNMDGSSGPAVEQVEQFVEKLRERGEGLEVETWDERMSSLSAERVLIEGDMRREKRKEVIDKIAAQIILQNYLDAQ